MFDPIVIKGCGIAGTDKDGFEAAVAAAKEADVVILTVGGKYGWGSNCTIGEGLDSDHIGLTGVQEELAKEIFETGTPAVLVLIESWFPGDTGGEALADVLFGDYNPAGRLPVTVARNAGQIPIYAPDWRFYMERVGLPGRGGHRLTAVWSEPGGAL